MIAVLFFFFFFRRQAMSLVVKLKRASLKINGTAKESGDKRRHESHASSDCELVVDNEEKADYAVCDCLQQNCPGCFFACRNCGSPFCGVECKKSRTWNYTSVVRVESAT